MIRQIFGKEWHEHHSRYLGYWLTLNAPIVLVALAIAFSSYARVPFADLSDALVLKYLPLSLAEGLLVLTLFMIVTGYLAVATFSHEIEDHSMFFIYEQGVSRRRYLAIKLLYGSLHVVSATMFAILLFPAVAYAMMLMSGKATMAGSGAAFAAVMAAAVRIGIWCALISLAAFMASALVAALLPKWWLSAVCSVVITVLFVGWGQDNFNILPDMPENSMSIGFGWGSGNTNWVTISRAFTTAEINAIARWWWGPLLVTLLAITVFTMVTLWLHSRKEMR